MIKIIAFDLVGVLVREKDIELTPEEDKLERLFGPNISDEDYLISARKIINKDATIIKTTEEIISKLYEVRETDLFKKVKANNENIKIIIATNHVSFVRNYIGETFGVNFLDDVLISAEIHKIKPNKDFYTYILGKYGIKPEELLFLDDNQENVNAAEKIGIKTIKVEKDMNLYQRITSVLNNK